MTLNYPVLLSTAYFGPVQFYAKLLIHPLAYIEQYEHYTKQTYRNRCEISGANGILLLVVPVVKGRVNKILIKDIKISYDTNWQRNHWRTIFSAYNSSPFFEFYKDDIRPFFEKKWKFLLDMNMAIHKKICDLMEIEDKLLLTSDFEQVPAGTLNLRERLTPKKNKIKHDPHFIAKEYTQVFLDKFGFTANLSILDLLFNEGPNSFQILESSIKNS